MLFQLGQVRGGIGAEEEARVSGGRGLDQREAVALALGHRQAVVMRLDAADEDGIAVDDQVMGGDRSGDVAAAAADVFDPLLGGDMLHHHAQAGGSAADRVKHRVDKHCLAVEDIDVRARDLAMNAERQPDLGHFFQHAPHLVEIAHAGIRVGGRPGRVELDRAHQPGFGGGGHVVRVGGFGEIKRHQRGEIHALRQRRHDPGAIGGGAGAGDHRRHQVRHHDGTGEMACGFGQDGFEHRAIAQMQVPVVGAADCQGLGHGAGITQAPSWGQWDSGQIPCYDRPGTHLEGAELRRNLAMVPMIAPARLAGGPVRDLLASVAELESAPGAMQGETGCS